MKNGCFIAMLAEKDRGANRENQHKSHANVIITKKGYVISLVGLQGTHLLRNFTSQPDD